MYKIFLDVKSAAYENGMKNILCFKLHRLKHEN